MQLAKLTDKGQITLSPETRRKLGVKGGDKVVLIERDNGYFITNANRLALQEAQTSFSGVADKLGLKDLDDVVNFIHEAREDA